MYNPEVQLDHVFIFPFFAIPVLSSRKMLNFQDSEAGPPTQFLTTMTVGMFFLTLFFFPYLTSDNPFSQ